MIVPLVKLNVCTMKDIVYVEKKIPAMAHSTTHYEDRSLPASFPTIKTAALSFAGSVNEQMSTL